MVGAQSVEARLPTQESSYLVLLNRSWRPIHVVVVVVVVFTLKTVLTSIQYPSLSYSSRQRNEFPLSHDWKTAALDPGAWYNTVQEGGCRFMAAWVREEENASNQRQKKRDAEEADKVEVAPGVTVASLRRFRTALIGPTQGLPKRRRLCH